MKVEMNLTIPYSPVSGYLWRNNQTSHFGWWWVHILTSTNQHYWEIKPVEIRIVTLSFVNKRKGKREKRSPHLPTSFRTCDLNYQPTFLSFLYPSQRKIVNIAWPSFLLGRYIFLLHLLEDNIIPIKPVLLRIKNETFPNTEAKTFISCCRR